MRRSSTPPRRRALALMSMTVLLGIVAIAGYVAALELTRSRVQVHRYLSRIQARWLARSGVEQCIANHLNGEPLVVVARAPATQAASTAPEAPGTQAAASQPSPLGIEGAELTCTAKRIGALVRLECRARMPRTRSLFVVQVDLRLTPGKARVLRWEEK